MAGIGTTSLYINVPTLPRDEFELYSTRLFDDENIGSSLES
jgi:hypothetical protein